MIHNCTTNVLFRDMPHLLCIFPLIENVPLKSVAFGSPKITAEMQQEQVHMYDGPEFRHLRYFVAVAEECNFGRAAQRLHVAQPSLSAQIKKLEDGIRATLFLRGRAGAELTPAGRAFLAEAKRLLQMRERAVQTTSSVHAGVDLPLRFGYSPFVDHHLVQEALIGYRELVTNGRIDSSSECSAPLVKMIVEGHLDAALVSMPVGEQNLFVHRVCVERLLVCLRRDDPLAREQAIPKNLIADLLRILPARNSREVFSSL